MSRKTKYSPDIRERTVRMLFDHIRRIRAALSGNDVHIGQDRNVRQRPCVNGCDGQRLIQAFGMEREARESDLYPLPPRLKRDRAVSITIRNICEANVYVYDAHKLRRAVKPDQ